MEIEESRVKELRGKIFQLALNSPSLEIFYWYVSLDDCFENNEFQEDMISTMIYRCRVLSWQKQPVNEIAWILDSMIEDAGYKVVDSEDIMKTRVVKVEEK